MATSPSPSSRILPREDDPDTAGFFAAARRHRLAVRSCRSCGATLHVPRSYCRYCGSFDVEWRELSGTGSLYAWTVVEHQVHPAFPVPHTLVLVEPDDAPTARLVGALPGRRHDLAVGQAMVVWFEELPGGAVLPQWAPAADQTDPAAEVAPTTEVSP